MNNAPRGILLDFYGTVVSEDNEVIAEVCAQVRDSVPDPEEVSTKDVGGYWRRTFSVLCEHAVGDSFRLQRELELESLRQTVAHFRSEAEADQLGERVISFWRRPELFDDARAFLERFDRPVCVVSDIDRSEIEQAVAHHGLPVQHIVTSEDVRAYKPRPECFRAGLQALEARPHQVVHIGDSLDRDVAGANALGIPAVWVNRSRRRAGAAHHLLAEVSGLAELDPILR